MIVWECEFCGKELHDNDEPWNDCKYCGGIFCDDCIEGHEEECGSEEEEGEE